MWHFTAHVRWDFLINLAHLHIEPRAYEKILFLEVGCRRVHYCPRPIPFYVFALFVVLSLFKTGSPNADRNLFLQKFPWNHQKSMVLKINDDFETYNLVDPAVSEVVHFFEMMCNFTGFLQIFWVFRFFLICLALCSVWNTPSSI